MQIYYTPLKTRGILTSTELQAIFSNLSVLLNVNEQLEMALLNMRSKNEDKVGFIFLEMVLFSSIWLDRLITVLMKNAVSTGGLLQNVHAILCQPRELHQNDGPPRKEK